MAKRLKVAERLDRVISDTDVETIAQKLKKWEILGSHIGLSPQQEEEIRNNYYRDYAQQKRKFLYKWKELAGERATYRALIAAAKKIRCVDFAETVERIASKNQLEGSMEYPVVKRPPTVSLHIQEYAKYLQSVYDNAPLTYPDKSFMPADMATEFIKLALVKNKHVKSRFEADKFTRLTLEGDIDKILKVKQEISLESIFTGDGNKRVRLLVVEGAPGIGKSTLALHLCKQWPSWAPLEQFSLVVLHKLRDKDVRNASNICDLFPWDEHSDRSGLVAKEVGNGKNVLLVFDGFDEFPVELRKSEQHLVMKILEGRVFPDATVLVTSRPSASVDLQYLLRMNSAHKHIEIVGFSEPAIQCYAEHVFGSGSDILADFNTYLSANPIIKSMMYNPLNCSIITEVYQWTAKSGKPVPHTQTQLYNEMTLCRISRHMHDLPHDSVLYQQYIRNKGKSSANNLPDQLQDLPDDSYLYHQLMKIGKLAFEGKKSDKIIFEEVDIPEDCNDLGLIEKHCVLYRRNQSTTYNFFHLTMQEFMSAFYISQLPASDQRMKFQQLNSRAMDVVWRFVAGLTKMEGIGWSEVYKNSDVTLLFIGCVYEAQDDKNVGSFFTRKEIRYENDSGLSNYDAYALGYCVSKYNNTWKMLSLKRFSEHVFALGMGEYGGGSIESLKLVLSPGIMNESERLLTLPCTSISATIKSLTLKDSSIDQRGFDSLADCIPHLSSLTSLNISDNPGGDESVVKLMQALKKHSKVESLYIVHILMGVVDAKAVIDLVQSQGSQLTFLQWSYVEFSLSQQLPRLAYHELLKTLYLSSPLSTLCMLDLPQTFLKYVDTINRKLSTLHVTCLEEATPFCDSCSKLSQFVRKSVCLKELILRYVPLAKAELHTILQSLETNQTLQKLKIITRVSAESPSRCVKDEYPELTHSLKVNTSQKELHLDSPSLDREELLFSLENNHTLESLTFYSNEAGASLGTVKDCSRLTHSLKVNTPLKSLRLQTILTKEDIHAILLSLEGNCTLETLDITSETAKTPPGYVSDCSKLYSALRVNTSLKFLSIKAPSDPEETNNIVLSLKDNHTLKLLGLELIMIDEQMIKTIKHVMKVNHTLETLLLPVTCSDLKNEDNRIETF